MSRLTNDEIRNRAISIIRNLTAEENGLTHGDLGILSSFLLIERTDKDKLTHYKDLEEQGRLIERKDGKWLFERQPDGTPYCFHCSVCDPDFKRIDIKTATPYCPNCGAKMDEVEE